MVTINKNNKFNFSLGLLLAVMTLNSSFSVYSMSSSAVSGSGPAVTVSVSNVGASTPPITTTTTTVTVRGSFYAAAAAISNIIGKGVDFTASLVGGAAICGGSVLHGAGLATNAVGESTGRVLRNYPVATTTLIAIPAAIAGAILLYGSRGISYRR